MVTVGYTYSTRMLKTQSKRLKTRLKKPKLIVIETQSQESTPSILEKLKKLKIFWRGDGVYFLPTI